MRKPGTVTDHHEKEGAQLELKVKVFAEQVLYFLAFISGIVLLVKMTTDLSA